MTNKVETISDEIYDKAFQRVILLLKTMDCKYEIIDKNNKKYTSGKEKSSQPYGFWQNYVKEFLQGMAPLETRYIDCKDLSPSRVQAAACNYMLDHYDLGLNLGDDQKSYTTTRLKEKNQIAVTFLG